MVQQGGKLISKRPLTDISNKLSIPWGQSQKKHEGMDLSQTRYMICLVSLLDLSIMFMMFQERMLLFLFNICVVADKTTEVA